MDPVEGYKGISNRLLVFGFQPIDIVIILVGFLFIHGIGDSLKLDLVYFIVAYIIARKLRLRPQGFFVSLASFLLTPTWVPVPEKPEKKQ